MPLKNKLSNEEKMLILAKTIKKNVIRKEKLHLMFVLKFLRHLSQLNLHPQFKNFKQIKLYLEAIVLKN